MSMEVRVIGKCSSIDISGHAFMEAQIYGGEMFSSSSHRCRRTKRNQAIRLNQGWPLRTGVARSNGVRKLRKLFTGLKWKGCGIFAL